jgi:N-acetylmuramoyl-L-alanine amidase
MPDSVIGVKKRDAPICGRVISGFDRYAEVVRSLLSLVLLVTLGCGAEPRPFELVREETVAAMSSDAARAYGASLEQAMRRAGIGGEATETRIQGAGLARALATKLHDDTWLRKARAWLSIAAADGGDARARCAAASALVRLERDDLGDADAARETLLRARDEGDDACRESLAASFDADAPDFEGFEPRAEVHAALAVEAAPSTSVRVILLDPGHGGDEHGARIEGVRESKLALDITRRAAMLLTRALPTTRILMTRQDDVDITLDQRAEMARSVDADLFVSVHLNASNEPVLTGGVTTFVLDTEGDEAAVRLAARENGTEAVNVTGMQRLLAGLHREQQGEASRVLAEMVHTSLLGSARQILPTLPDRGVKSALFYVLVGAEMPAILVEASFMSRPEELTALRTVRYRQALAEGIADGVVRYARTH